MLKGENIYSLYYIFPLIERIILEIYKLVPGADIEYIEQGIMRTPKSIIESNKYLQVLPENLEEIIKKYYGDDGARNKVFHVSQENEGIEVSWGEILFLLSQLLGILNNKLEIYTDIEIKEIEKL